MKIATSATALRLACRAAALPRWALRRGSAAAALLLGLSLAGAPALSAATVTWGTPTAISGDSDVLTGGTFVYAYTFGADYVTPSFVNGVTFLPFGVPTYDTYPAMVDSVTLAVDSGNSFHSTNSDAGTYFPPFDNLSVFYKALLQSAVSPYAFGSMTLTLGALTIGQEYQVQFWSNDSNQYLTNLYHGTVYTAGNSVTVDNNTGDVFGGVGQWVIGSFTAGATTQDFVLTSSSPSDDYPTVNAFQLVAIPEPATTGIAMAALLGGAILLRRRRTAA